MADLSHVMNEEIHLGKPKQMKSLDELKVYRWIES
jgi:hypothetical protein